MNHPIVAVLESLEADSGSLHVGEERGTQLRRPEERAPEGSLRGPPRSGARQRGDGGEEALEALAVLGLHFPFPVHREARMLPSLEALHRLREDFFPPEQHLEKPFTEDLRQSGKIDLLHGEEKPVFAEKSQGYDRMSVGVSH